ncbi:MAG: DNA repair protein RecN [Candidatus Berkiella sp.]
MLQHLYIKDLSVLAHADIHFASGMTVITGETGAGKSILLDALALAIGERGDSQMIRPGSDKAEIAATFDVSKLSGAILWLNDLDLTCDDDSHCIIRRILYSNGRSKAFINGRPVTTAQLRLLGDYLVQIHGQHQHQLLLKPQEQLRLLDAFGQHDTTLSQVKTAFREYEALILQREALLTASRTSEAKMDLLHYQIAELQSLHLREHELKQLDEEHDKLAHSRTFIETTEQALALLENADEGNVLQWLGQLQMVLRPLENKSQGLKNAFECIENASIQLKEASDELNSFVSQLEVDPERLYEVEQRLERIHEIARKHKVEASQLYYHFCHLQEQALQFANQEQFLAKIDENIALAKQQYQQIAKKLTKAREQAARQLASEITTCVQQLAMPGAVFTIDLIAYHDNELHAHGNETVCFGISANPGHPPQPLNKVASGGELSRISLALQLVTAKYVATPCLVFDEVDVGISGKVGAVVGKSLQRLAQSAQVLCVTHLPQVAACGENHLQVVKQRSENNTVTQIHMLNATARVEAIAQMLGGMDVTTQARANAKQLLKQTELLEN